MTFLLLLPVALSVATPQELSAVPIPGAAPTVAVPADSPPPVPAGGPELADPLVDPATVAAPPAARNRHSPGDPLEGFNRKMFGVNQALDKAFYRPVAMGYKHIVPKPVRSGLRNFFANLQEPVVFANFILQLRIGKAARTLGRFVINSTVGVGGLVDVAKSRDIRLPHLRNSFGDTLAWYGVGPGPYVFLPLVGPSTLRDALGGPVDDVAFPMLVISNIAGKPFKGWRFIAASTVIPGLDLRAESDADLRALTDNAVDPYATLRSAWLQNRAAEVAALHHHAAPVAPELGDPLNDPAVVPAPAPAIEPLTTPAPATGGAQP
ncbi:VacJ family lipoprotein [Novosphingobium sp. FSW06-99]|uniref:MlaA family lipoprotein n=1 Tax=Novosphingobium sp. FSW06-99 TaxID=1739113 RepID=UPI00076C005F|nr:VacJ family lipoprotein [Novosphingobium sp. FSW06-99]KUR79021.1 hypothetical protein AQZ49_06300 [Novosphingobium sp. FSW06-99]